MSGTIYRYDFSDSVEMGRVEDSLLISVISAEALHGRAQVNLDADFQLNEEGRFCEVEAGSEVGRDIARILTGLLTVELSESAFTVARKNLLKDQ